ncbi:MAG: GAF domain-containing protein [Lyngbya sp. HA4199-MV5]|jgi:methyl-accepting chemotaxis protein|nr:GAF domain-containing protein [Lyngbya sp. HA4199-MV5]
MTNQLANQVQPLPAIDEPSHAEVSERSRSGLSLTASEPTPQQQSRVPRWFSAQSVRRKYLLGWITSGVFSVTAIAGATLWFTASVNQMQAAQTGTKALTKQQQETLKQLALQQQLLTLAFMLATQTGVMILLYRAIAKPIKQLQQDTQMFALGAREIRAASTTTDEIGKIAQVFNQLADSAVTSDSLLTDQTRQREGRVKRTHFIGQIASSRARTEQDLETIFEQAVQGAKAALMVDRVVIYRFYADWSGYISTEAVVPGLPIALADTIEDACISETLIEAYRQGRVVATNDVFNAGFHPEHLKLMMKLNIKANLVTPILKDDQLYGLLIAHHCTAPHPWDAGEIDFLKELAIQVGLSLDRVTFLEQKEAETERARQLHQISSRVRDALSLQEIYNVTVRGVRETLKTDRAIVYLFDEKWQGTIVAEAVEHQFPTALGTAIADPCFAENYVEKYKQGRVQALEDIYKAGLTECHLAQLEPFKVRANLVAPILARGTLHGLLVVHQCSRTRAWEAPEVTFFQEVAAQVGLAIDRSEVLQQLERSSQQAEHLAEEQRQQREVLQRQLVDLLSQVEGAASGNLTVRADVTVGEIGTVADFFNAIVESLRQIVVRVKQSATQVNTALGESETTIQKLVTEALQQSKDITQTLNSVDRMTTSIQAVAESAHQAAMVTNTASVTAEASQEAINITVQSIFALRETMSETAHKMKRLGESSQSISKVISLINQIALKTNMLALNASIEAARAGEGGLGFAVVAEEVGELATQSSAATQEIEQLVDDIQRETRQVLEAMEQSTVQMVEGTRLVEDAKQNLGQLRHLSQETDQLVQSISEATIAQTQISQIVTQLMQQLAQRSQQSAQTSQQVTNSLHATVDISQALQRSVSTFKIEMPD